MIFDLVDYDRFIELNPKVSYHYRILFPPYFLEMLSKFNGHNVIKSFQSLENTQAKVIPEAFVAGLFWAFWKAQQYPYSNTPRLGLSIHQGGHT